MALKLKVLLGISFVANVALMAGLFMNRPAPRPVVKFDSATNEAVTARASRPVRSDKTVQTVTVTRDKDFDWGSVESQDYREYIENLRAIGCPEETIRDIIIADINKLYASKMASLYPSAKDTKFWRVDDLAAHKEEKERKHSRRDLEQEKRDLIQQLIGVDYEAEMARWSGKPDNDAERYGFLSPEKQEGSSLFSVE